MRWRSVRLVAARFCAACSRGGAHKLAHHLPPNCGRCANVTSRCAAGRGAGGAGVCRDARRGRAQLRRRILRDGHGWRAGGRQRRARGQLSQRRVSPTFCSWKTACGMVLGSGSALIIPRLECTLCCVSTLLGALGVSSFLPTSWVLLPVLVQYCDNTVSCL